MIKQFSVDERTNLFRSAISKAHKLYNLMPLSLDEKHKLGETYNTYNLEILVQNTKCEYFKEDMHNIFPIVTPEEDEYIKEVKDLYSKYSNITIDHCASSTWVDSCKKGNPFQNYAC
jgi:hypothetical protein